MQLRVSSVLTENQMFLPSLQIWDQQVIVTLHICKNDLYPEFHKILFINGH